MVGHKIQSQKAVRSVPRGLRNNNPLNIRIGNSWLGERAPWDCTDPEFEEFVSMIYGLRAAFCVIRRYIRHYHRQTIRQIITSWAPANENDTERYVQLVSRETGISPDDKILYEDKPTMCALVRAMAHMEVGKSLPLDDIEKAYDLA